MQYHQPFFSFSPALFSHSAFLKGLNNKQRRPHYFTKDFVKLKQIPTWKEMAKSARIQQPEETIYPKDNNLNGKISLLRGDITKLEVDAIVNAGILQVLGDTPEFREFNGAIAKSYPRLG
ncbi:hypothetical protein Chor_005177 [Crotalus horridus]